MSLTALAETILAHAKELDQRGVVDINSKVGFRNLTQNDLACRARLITTVKELQRLALGPAEALCDMICAGTVDILCLEALVRYQIPTHVPATGTTTIAALSQAVPPQLGNDPETLARLVRAGIVQGVFAEDAASPGTLAHTPLSLLLRDPDFADLVRFYVEEAGGAGRRELDALERWPGSREPAHTGFALANKNKNDGGEEEGENATGLFFAELAKEPRRVRQAQGAFAALAQLLVQAGREQLVESALWAEVDEPGAVVVDVGGGRGLASMQIADSTKHLRFMVQDLPGTVRLGEEGLPEGYRGRVEFAVRDFFEEQRKVEGARVWFLRKVLHDFPDHYCVRIIRNIVPALGDGDRVVVCERLMPETSKAGYEQREARFSDICMLQLLNGRERSESEWKKLFTEADSRFELEFEPWTNNPHGLIKATWKP